MPIRISHTGSILFVGIKISIRKLNMNVMTSYERAHHRNIPKNQKNLHPKTRIDGDRD